MKSPEEGRLPDAKQGTSLTDLLHILEGFSMKFSCLSLLLFDVDEWCIWFIFEELLNEHESLYQNNLTW